MNSPRAYLSYELSGRPITAFILCFRSIRTRDLLLTDLIEIWLTPWLGHRMWSWGPRRANNKSSECLEYTKARFGEFPFPRQCLRLARRVLRAKFALEAPIYSIRHDFGRTRITLSSSPR